MTTGKELAQELAGDFLKFAKETLEMSLTDTVKLCECRDVMKVYEAAEAARIVFTNAYQIHHRLMSVANSLRIEDVG